MIVTGFWSSVTETLCPPQLHAVAEANTVVKRMFAVQFHDGCLVVGSGSSKHAIWCEVLTSVIPVYCLPPNSTIVILLFLTPCGSQEEMNCRLDIVGIQD